MATNGPRKKVEVEAPAARLRAIKAAATWCIRKYGARKVSVDDIAAAAGISRRTFYRFYPERRAVMEAVLLERLEIVATAVRAVIKSCATFEDAVVNGTIETLRRAREDKIYTALAESDHTLLLDLDQSGRSPARESLFNSIWHHVFKSAQDEGLLKTEISLNEAEDWLRSIHYMLALRTDLTDEGRSELLRKFVIPSLIEHRLDQKKSPQ